MPQTRVGVFPPATAAFGSVRLGSVRMSVSRRETVVKYLLALLLTGAALRPGLAAADLVELLDGTVLKGRILRGTETRVILEETVGNRTGKREIPHDAVHAVTIGDVRVVVNGSGLIGCWEFEDGEEGGRVRDSSDLEIHGFLENGTVPVRGRKGGGLRFDGLDDHVRISTCPAHDNLSALTFAAWVFPEQDSHWHVIDKDDGDKRIYAEGRDLLLSGHIRYRGRHAHADSAHNTLKLNAWQHVAMTWSTGDHMVRLYWEGDEVAYSNQAAGAGVVLDDTGHPFTLGARGALGKVSFFRGVMDECRVYRRVLSLNEIRLLRRATGP